MRRSLTFETQRKTKEGRTFPVEVTANYFAFDGQEYSFAFSRDITERKRAEEALLFETTLLEAQSETAIDGILVVTPSGKVVWSNKLFECMFGVPDGLLETRNDSLLMRHLITKVQDPETFKAKVQHLYNHPEEKSRDELRLKDGKIFDRYSAPLMDSNGGDYGRIWYFRDITERKREEEVFERLAAVVESSDDAIIGKRLDGTITAWNPGAEKLFGYSASEMLGQPIAMLLPPERAHEEAEILARIAKGKSVDHFETIRVRKDGKHIDISATISPIRDSSGAIVGASKIARDITERKLAEEKVRESNELVRLVLDSIPEAVYGIDTQGRCTFCNPSCLRILGYQESTDLYGKDMHVLAHHSRADGTPYPVEECYIYEAFRRGQGTHIDNEVLWRRDRTSFSAEYWSHPIYQGGKVIGAVVTFVNITERKRVERVLLEAKEAAEAANRAKSQFLANMSHEIRTPMNGVIGVAGLLLDTKLTAEQRQYTEIVRTSGEALMTVINDILDFSKIEARKLTLETTDFDLRTVLENAVAVLGIKAAEKGLALALELKPGTPRLLRVDPGRLRQILVNLLGNAVKFTQHGGVSIWVNLESGDDESAENEAEDGGSVRLRFHVTDTGIGFPQERAAALFEPFVQADGSSTRRYGGTGLGLTISKQLAELMGGRIGVESQEGKGSTFWFTAVFEKQPAKRPSGFSLSLTPPTAATTTTMTMKKIAKGSLAATAAQGGVQPPATAQTRAQARILLAEDNAVNQAVAVAMLTKLGYHADLVANGVEALRALREADYDLVLMDCGMPEMDGYEATRRIRDRRAETRNPLIPIVALTADAMSGDRDKCVAAGMSDYIAKPVEVRKLGDMLETWLRPAASELDLKSVAGEISPSTGPSPAEQETVFNPQELLARLMGDQDLAGKVIAAFLDDAPRQLRTLKKMLEEGDAVGARRQAHTLKGAAATLSAEALRALCCEAQEAAAANDLERASILLLRMQEQFERLKTTLQQSGWRHQASGGAR